MLSFQLQLVNNGLVSFQVMDKNIR